MATYPTTLKTFQWSRPGAHALPRLSSPITSTATTLTFTSPPRDENDAIITGNFLMGIQNASGYVETVYVPAAAMSADGLTATGVTRGIDLLGGDYTTGDANLASDHGQDSLVFCNISAIYYQLLVNVVIGTLGTGANDFRIGDETDSDITVYAQNADANKPFFRYDASANEWVYSNDGTSSTPFGTGSGVTGGTGIDITSGVVSLDLTDTGAFVETSAGAGDSGKGVILNSSGLLDTSVIPESSLDINTLESAETLGETVAVSEAVFIDGDGRFKLADGNDTDKAFRFGGVARAAGVEDDSRDIAIPGPKTTIPSLSLNDGRLNLGQQQTSSTGNVEVNGTLYEAQTFQPGTGQTNVGMVRLSLTVTGTPSTGSYVADIYTVDGSNHPDSLLGSSTAIAASTINTGGSGDYDFEFSSAVSVTAGTTYAIVLRRTTSQASNYAGWDVQNTNAYANGNRVDSTDSGSTWSSVTGQDFKFQVYYRSVGGESVFLSDTAGDLQLNPGTYYAKVGQAVNQTEMLQGLGVYGLLVSYSFSVTSGVTETIDTEFDIGFMPRFILAELAQTSGDGTSQAFGCIGFWMNTGAESSLGVGVDWGTVQGSGSTLQRWSPRFRKGSILNQNYDLSSGNFTMNIDIQSIGEGKMTVRRDITVNSVLTTTFYVRLNLMS